MTHHDLEAAVGLLGLLLVIALVILVVRSSTTRSNG
jgi:hypothetical protein